MRIDQLRILEVMRAYEKSRTDGRRQGQDPDTYPAVRDEVIISTEAKRRQILDRVLGQAVERLRNLPLSDARLPDIDAILEEAAQDIERAPLDPEEKARLRERGLADLRRARAYGDYSGLFTVLSQRRAFWLSRTRCSSSMMMSRSCRSCATSWRAKERLS